MGWVRGKGKNPADINTKCSSNVTEFNFLRDFYLGGRKLTELEPRFKSTISPAVLSRFAPTS